MKHTLPLVVALLASPSLADETRQLDAHEHGVGELNIAIEGSAVAIELHAPGADIVGFEYAAQSAEDREAIEAAVAMLARPLDLFVLPTAAECTVTRASAELEGEGEHEHDEDRAGGHDDHGDENHGDEHHGDEGHAEEHHEDGESHTEFHAEYLLTCADPASISEIGFAYFDAFPNARELEVQIVTGSGAQAFEVERNAPRLDLRGMF